ncbi:MAG: methionyl-tRNA formyltransferase [Anaerolineae bacterium]|nr:methionyl-tRNA formyltransferase [Anaerolineae bacterium]MCB9105976.1 methionyl-tRNA formyltransferase [Anaerolineales bacterium]
MIRILFFGMTGRFSIPPFEQLLNLGVDLCGVIVPAALPHSSDEPQPVIAPPPPPTDLPLVDPYLAPNIIHRAWANDLPVWEVGSLSTPGTLDLLRGLQPDLIVVACFPFVFPSALLSLPRYGCLNLHPSLLPAYRGPAPLFWIARQDERFTGVTLHLMAEALDSGDIVAQTRFERPEGISEAELEQRCAIEGSNLLADVIERLKRGQSLPRRPQIEAEASYFPSPSGLDFQIPIVWSAQRAFNFVRGAEEWPLFISVGGTDFFIREGVSYRQDQILGQPYKLIGSDLWVQFQPGVLRANIRSQNRAS